MPKLLVFVVFAVVVIYERKLTIKPTQQSY